MRRSAFTAAGLALATALAFTPASAQGVGDAASSAGSTTQSATSAATDDLASQLDSGSLQIDIAKGFAFKPATGGGASIVAADGSRVDLVTTIDVGSKSYTARGASRVARQPCSPSRARRRAPRRAHLLCSPCRRARTRTASSRRPLRRHSPRPSPAYSRDLARSPLSPIGFLAASPQAISAAWTDRPLSRM